MQTADKNLLAELTLPVLNLEAQPIDTFKLDPLIFDGKVNLLLVHHAVVTYLANQRKGLASTKTRGEVRGGGRKPWRQKGTGRARVGSLRSPLWRKGGITFGQRPRSFYKRFPLRMRLLALKSVLNAKFKDNELLVLEGLSLNSHKTKEFVKVLNNLKLNSGKNRFVVETADKNLRLSTRNIEDVEVNLANSLNAYEALNCKQLVFTRKALEVVQERIKGGLGKKNV